MDETKLSRESIQNDDYEFYLNFLINENNKDDLQNEDIRVFFMFRLIFEKSQMLINNSLNCEQTDIYLQKIDKLQSDLNRLNEHYSNKIENKLQEFNKNNKIYFELLKNIVDNKAKLSRVFIRDPDDAELESLQIDDKDYKSSNNGHILNLISKFDEAESLLANKSTILKDKKELFQEIKSVILFFFSLLIN